MSHMIRSAWLAMVIAGCGSTPPPPKIVVPPPAETPVATLTPPVAAVRPHDVTSPNGTRNDPYYWLRDDTRKNPEVLAYLAAENEYAARIMAPAKELEDTLFTEMRSRIKEDDSSVPTLDNGYWYYTRFETGKQHPIHARKKANLDAPEQVLLDGNALAEGHAFYAIGDKAVTRDGKLLAWIDDTVGRNQFTLHVKDIASGALLPETAANVAAGLAWANDNKTLFFTGKDEATLRQDRVFRVVLGGKPEQIYQEPDAQYYVSVGATKSRRYVAITAEATTSSETRLIDADKPTSAAVVYLPRSKDHLYTIDHLDGRFVMWTNADAKNFRLVEIAQGKQNDRKAWKELIPHSPEMLVEDFALYHDFIAATVRVAGLRKIRVLPGKRPAYFLDAPDPTYAMGVLNTPDPKAKAVRYSYGSPTTPNSVFEADVTTKAKRLLKQQPVPGYDPTLYTSEYLHATASDGTQIPISVVYKTSTKRDGTAPLHIFGYGAYGLSMEPWFSSAEVSMLDRGWVYAIAHVRGGQEMGRAWYEAGKLMAKQNTFTDFIAATELLVAQGYGAKGSVFASSGSAGGLLMGVIANLRPDLYRGIAATVPFVDIVTTMLDETIPLTTNEFEEWGNPKTKAAYDYMLAYSPYDNVKRAAYPAIYVRTGLWDSQVQYYEPAKWIAKLRAMVTGKNPIVMDIDMTAGHGGASGRFDRLRQVARQLAFFVYVNEQPDRR
jgi:oligopeptidase B